MYVIYWRTYVNFLSDVTELICYILFVLIFYIHIVLIYYIHICFGTYITVLICYIHYWVNILHTFLNYCDVLFIYSFLALICYIHYVCYILHTRCMLYVTYMLCANMLHTHMWGPGLFFVWWECSMWDDWYIWVFIYYVYLYIILYNNIYIKYIFIMI